MPLDEFLALGRMLTTDRWDESSMGACLGRVARFLETNTAASVVEAVLPTDAEVREAVAHVGRLDHVGFVAPSVARQHISAAALSAGFEDVHRFFSSRIVARELGALAGKPAVETTVFEGRRLGERPLNVEVFMPDGSDHERVRSWIAGGAVPHIALSVTSAASMKSLADILADRGFALPRFMGGGPLVNEKERVSAAYYDRTEGGHTLRIELFHIGA